MANNRMYIECTACEEPDLFFLGKRTLSGYYSNRDDDMVAPLDKWLDTHSHYDLRSQDHFRIVYECQKNYDLGGLHAQLAGKISPVPDVQTDDDEIGDIGF